MDGREGSSSSSNVFELRFPERLGGPSLGIVWIMFCSIIVRLAKLVIVDRCFISLVMPLDCELAQLLLVYSSYATRFSKVFFSRTRFWT